MAISAAPRSVSDATRFTPTTPHASSKPAASSSSSSSGSSSARGSGSRFPPPAGGGGAGGRRPPPGGGPAPVLETPQQRVARLRAAHLAARNAEVSSFDRVVAGGRRFFDSAHKLTVVGLLGFTAIAGLLTVYTSVDMLTYNRKRKAEFLEAQRRMEADSLDAARLAYMRGDATDEQMALVEDALEREAVAGDGRAGGGFVKLPSILGAPATVETEMVDPARSSTAAAAAAAWPGSQAAKGENKGGADTEAAKQPSGIRGWLFGGLKSEESQNIRAGQGEGVQTIENKQAHIRDTARSAFEREKENQRRGGPLDRIGLPGPGVQNTDEPKKSGWW